MTHTRRPRHLIAIAAVAAIVFALAGGSVRQAEAASGCDLVAAPTGSITAAGTELEPLKQASDLITSLAPGQTGCLRGGTYSEDLKIATPGVTLMSFPGERAKLVGRLWVAKGANNVTVQDLDLDGRNPTKLPSPTVNADDATFRDNDVTNGHTAICFNIGHPVYGAADGTLIESNRIHDCGALPAANHDHGIYVSEATDTVIRGNVIYDNADRGIQLYPNSVGALVTGNVIDGNGQGVIFGGDEKTASSDNVVENNVITNSKIRYNVESSWGGPVGHGNVVRNNCVSGGGRDVGDGGIQGPERGFTATGNVLADPDYANRSAKDFTLLPGSPCADILGRGAVGSNPASSGTKSSGESVKLSLKTHRHNAKRGKKVRLSGRATNQRRVAIEVNRRGNWRRVKRSSVRHGSFQLSVRVRQHGTVRYRATAVAHAKASRPVQIKVVG